MMSKFAFIDVNTQKCFVEHFGERAIPDCPEIRENLMHLTHLAVNEEVPILSTVFYGDDHCVRGSNDADKVFDSLASDHVFVSGDFQAGHSQYVFEDIDKLFGSLEILEVESVFVYGVPLDPVVREIVISLIGKDLKVWVVSDAVKAYSEEQSILDELKQIGAKLVDTRMLDKYVRYENS